MFWREPSSVGPQAILHTNLPGKSLEQKDLGSSICRAARLLGGGVLLIPASRDASSFYFYFWKMGVSPCILSWLRTHYISQADLEFEVTLLSSPQEQLLKVLRELGFFVFVPCLPPPQKLIPVLMERLSER